MPVTLQNIGPQQIEAESFRIIAEELGPHSFDAATFAVIQRVIHATGDFTFAENMLFTEGVIDKAVSKIKGGQPILTDVTMVATAISKNLLHHHGCQVICKIADSTVADEAKAANTTRADMAMTKGIAENPGIIAIGNAPTALLKAMELVSALPQDQQPVLIGVPVGFVNAAESKQMLAESQLAHITSLGRKGGSPVAAAIVNALIRLAEKGM